LFSYSNFKNCAGQGCWKYYKFRRPITLRNILSAEYKGKEVPHPCHHFPLQNSKKINILMRAQCPFFGEMRRGI
jgi:hypothetical protein